MNLKSFNRRVDEHIISTSRKIDAGFLAFFAVIMLVASLALTACATKPVKVTPTPVEMPALPAPLNQRAQDLPPITATDLHGIIREGAETDRRYNNLRDRHNAVLTAWDCVRSALLDQTDAVKCFRQ